MSRIGKKIINIPDQVKIKIDKDLIMVQGPEGELSLKLNPHIKIDLQDKTIAVDVNNNKDKYQKSLWGTFRQLLNNLLIGVTEGFTKKLEINGVGYKADLKGKELILHVGYSHPVIFSIPDNIEVKIEKNLITISGIDKQLVGETAAQIRKIKPPEPYKGKGIKYVDEVIRRKAGKQAKATAS